MGRIEDFKEALQKREAFREALKNRPPITDDLDRQIKDLIEQIDEYGDEGDFNKFIHACSNELKTFLRDFNFKHKDILRQKGQHYPPKWMKNDDLICGPAKKSVQSRYPKIFDILNALEARDENGFFYYVIHPADKQFNDLGLEALPFDAEQGAGKPPAGFVADFRFYNTILTGLGMEKDTLQKYLTAFCGYGFLQRQKKKTGKYHNLPVYYLGYFSQWIDDGVVKYKINRFLTAKMHEALQEFSL